MLGENTSIFVPTDRRLSDIASRTRTLDLQPDSDDVLRQSQLWHPQSGVISPSSPLAVALALDNFSANARKSVADLATFLTNYVPLGRIDATAILNGEVAPLALARKRCFWTRHPNFQVPLPRFPPVSLSPDPR
jgi:hypothetical protein